ncbi:MAG: hypothetical protein F4X58_12745 [Chloroflexi bacterium]|nr:hypothetical protein [Chloroflexota bacterium]MYC02778.1 hypothetical protein [Chloroflexota bacterium]
MRPILFEGATRRWSLGVALLAALTILLINFAPSITAQDNPRPPHWFWGQDLDLYVGDQVVAINQDGQQVASTTVDSRGTWSLTVSPENARTVTLRLISDSGTRATDPLDVMDGGFDAEGISITDFRHRISEELGGSDATIAVRIIARRADDGRIEFGMRGPDGEEILPPRRFFPAGGPGHTRWLRSTEIDFGDGFVGNIIARYVEADGRTEFGFRVAGYDDHFPTRRFFPATGPDHDRWLSSSEIEIGMPR